MFAGGRSVAFVEDGINNFEDRGETLCEFGSTRNLVGHLLLGERSLCADDALRDGGFGGQEGSGYFIGRETGEEAERERDTSLGWEDGMTRGEDEPEQVVAHIVIERIEIDGGFGLCGLKDFLVFLLETFVAAQEVDGAKLRRGHEPRGGIVGDAGLGPLLERGYESVLREFFREANIADDAREGRDQFGGLDPPDCIDCAMDVVGRHYFRSEHSGGRRRKIGAYFLTKSSGAKIWRISISVSSSCGLGQRFSHSTASSIELTCQIQ